MSGRGLQAIWRVHIGDAVGRVVHLELGGGLVGEGASLRGAGGGDGGGGGGDGGVVRRRGAWERFAHRARLVVTLIS